MQRVAEFVHVFGFPLCSMEALTKANASCKIKKLLKVYKEIKKHSKAYMQSSKRYERKTI